MLPFEIALNVIDVCSSELVVNKNIYIPKQFLTKTPESLNPWILQLEFRGVCRSYPEIYFKKLKLNMRKSMVYAAILEIVSNHGKRYTKKVIPFRSELIVSSSIK